ncbi:Jag family protein [Frigoribacterium faeni]|uniref:RNA-binding protein n=1 Tax=Frigoribacterium faeni TaxID=145483 RepID=A0A7W3PJH0_9MICO|nr:R3H domain-containing nucleic acid-binding protein [Frigoribacterium faeni]MBA8814425.1 spoIIIJ-associated protein [Frigoribacterium faeni]GEK83625.1 RNA-binding protein [Frigoribacterium faeni]
MDDTDVTSTQPDAANPSPEEARGDDATTAPSETDGPRASSASEVDEGEIAADYIEELLDICDFDGDIDIEVRAGRSYISVDSSGEGNLRVLSKPDTVNALQELTRIAVQTKTGEFSRLILDIGGSRATREAELGAMVDRAVEKIEEGATAASLPPMSSYERKLVHDIVAARGFTSESEGEGRDRHTVITRA